MSNVRSLFGACLCGTRPSSHEKETPGEKLCPSPSKTSEHISAASEAITLSQLQRDISAYQGTWQSRSKAILASIAAFSGGASVRLYGTTRGCKDGRPASFVFLAGVDKPAGSDGHACRLLAPSQQAWPVICMQEIPAVPFNGSGSRAERTLPSLDSLPVLLDRMLAAQAPVFYSASSSACAPPSAMRAAGGTSGNFSRSGKPTTNGIGGPAASTWPDIGGCTSDYPDATVALVPLTAGGVISGALWLARYGPGSNHKRSSKDAASVTAEADEGAASVRAPAGPQPPGPDSSACCGSSLLTNEQALLQLGLSVSMCLFCADLPYVMTLVEGLHHLAAASNMQQLVDRLCDNVTQHIRQRFHLEPRVVAALVPDPSSAVGLLFSSGVAGALGATSSRTLQASRTLSHSQPVRPACFSSESRGRERLVDDRIEGTSTGRADTAGSSRATGRVAVLVAKEGGDLQLAEWANSATMVHSIQRGLQQQQKGRAVGGLGGGGGGSGAVLMEREGNNSTAMSRSPRPWTGQRSVALTTSIEARSDIMADGSLLAPHHLSAAPTTLRVKPFPLAQTLLRQLTRRAAAAGGGEDVTTTSGGSALLTGSGGGPYHSRVLSAEVEDCALHIQDPTKPSRDILLLLANARSMAGPVFSRDSDFTAATRDHLANSATGLGHSGFVKGSSGPAASGGSFTAVRRAVCSLLLLALPTGDGKGLLGLYLTFPQQLPQQLLREASASLREVLEIASPLVEHKLLYDMQLELDTLANATPGSYTVLEGPERKDCATANILSGGDLRRFASKPNVPGDPIIESSPTLLSLHSQAEPSFFDGSRYNTGGSGVVTGRLLNLVDMAGGAHVLGEHATATDVLSTANIIHVEDLDAVNNTLRAQMPLLVASMQNIISNARAEAAVAEAAAAAVSANRFPSPCSDPRAPHLGAGQGDMAQLELHSDLGLGSFAVVFKGKLGTLDCAVKVMEMPDVGDVDNADIPDKLTPAVAAAAAKAQAGTCGDNDEGVGKAARGGGGAARQLAARRALLRNAMEVAVMTSISHPNILQVYNTFSNVTLGRRSMPDGTPRLCLRPVDSIVNGPDDPPVCVAIVCEWCDKGCLNTALEHHTFPSMLASLIKSSPKAHTSGATGGHSVNVTGALLYKGTLMTLLDVAMALRHLHAYNLIHRDLKPANVLLKTNTMDPRGFTAKLADFGFVTLLNQPGDEKSGGEPFAFVEETCGTVTHMAPESLTKAARLYASCDVYSFGILMWDMMSGGVRPYPEVHPRNIVRYVRRGMRPVFDDGVPAEYRHLAQRCWAGDPVNRPRASELVATICQMLGSL